jgi:hypothetical protein
LRSWWFPWQVRRQAVLPVLAGSSSGVPRASPDDGDDDDDGVDDDGDDDDDTGCNSYDTGSSDDPGCSGCSNGVDDDVDDTGCSSDDPGCRTFFHAGFTFSAGRNRALHGLALEGL